MDHVSFTDNTGMRWSVREEGTAAARTGQQPDDVPGTAWLRFESEHEVRRLWHYPKDWRGLSPLQLESLLERASTVIARFRSVGHNRSLLNADGPPLASRVANRSDEPDVT